MTINQIRKARTSNKTISQVKNWLPHQRFRAYYQKILDTKFEEEPDYQTFYNCLAELQRFGQSDPK